MRSMIRIVLAGGLAMLALSAVTATAAQAATTEGPFFKLGGTRLTEGQTNGVAASASHSIKFSTAYFQFTCSNVSLPTGAKLAGSTGANDGTIAEETPLFAGCALANDGEPCEIENGKWTTEKLTGELAYEGSTRTGKLLMLIKPASGSLFGTAIFKGSGCEMTRFKMEGSVVGEVLVGGKSVEVGGGQEAASVEVTFSKHASELSDVYVESKGSLVATSPKLTVLGSKVKVEGAESLTLTGGGDWGVFS
jgi:hypothetical protein